MTLNLYHVSSSDKDRKLSLTIDKSGIKYFNRNGDLVFHAEYSEIDEIVLDERYHYLIKISFDFATFEFDPFFDGDYSENIELIRDALTKYANSDKSDRFKSIY